MFWPGFFKIFWPAVKLDKYFPHYFTIFCHIWWFFKVEHTKDAAEIWKIITCQKLKKTLVPLSFNPFFCKFWVPENRISGARYILSLYVPYYLMQASTCHCILTYEITYISISPNSKLFPPYGIDYCYKKVSELIFNSMYLCTAKMKYECIYILHKINSSYVI